MASTLNASNSGAGGLISTADASGVLQLQSAGTTAVTIDASQNVGIGVTPSAWSTANSIKALQIPSGVLWNFSTNYLYLGQNYYWNGSNRIYINTDGASEYQQNAGTHTWFTAPSGTAGTTATITERMRITSGGNVLVGATSGGTYSDCKMTLSANSGTTKWDMGPYTATPTNFLISSGTGGVFLSGTATSWSALSDERQKTNLEPIVDASNKLNTLRTVTGRYITDEETVSRAFLIAQDVQKVLPEAVDAQEDEDGTLGLRYTDLIPLLIAGFKEQQTIINDLKARVTALEAK